MTEKDLAQIYDLEVEPLTDSDLEGAGGGATGGTQAGGATNYCPSTTGCPPPQEDSSS
jgi:hypothetical protein